MGSGDVIEVIWDDPAPGVALVAPVVGVSQGWSNKVKVITTASTNLKNIKASPCTLGAISFQGPNTSTTYLKLYDKASVPDLANDVPFSVIQASNSGNYFAVPIMVLAVPGGIKLNNGLSIAVTGGVADTNTTSADGGQIVNIFTN
jgi:hypothetical protein